MWPLVTIEPHCEAVIPIRLLHRQESCDNRLQDKGLYARITLVSAGETGLVPVQIQNTSDKVQTIGAQTVVDVAKPVTSVPELDLHGVNLQCINTRQQVEESSGGMLPHPLKALWM